MKKYILIFTAAAACVMLFAGCSSEEGPSELDKLIEQLQTTHLTDDSPTAGAESEEAIPYKSLIGTVASYSESEIAVKSEGKEQKFKIDENTQILGGDPTLAKTVTVTYCEPEKKSKSITANVITILELTEAGTENTDPEPTEGSESVSNEAAPETASETISENTSETVSEAVSENTADTMTEQEPNIQSEADTDTPTETETDPEEAETQSETESQTDTETQSDSEAQTEAETEAQTGSGA